MIKKKIALIVILLGLIGVGLSYIFLSSVEHYIFDKDSTYFVNGVEYSIPCGSKGLINDDNTLTIEVGDFSFDAEGMPIYFNDSYEILLSSDMAIYLPDFNGKFNISKLIQLTTITYDDNDLSVTIKRNDDEKHEQYGFIFDGHNTYVFLEKFDVSFNGKSITLSPLSYAIVENDTWVQLYDETTKTYYYEEIDDDVLARSINKNYTINLGMDTITYYSKSTIMGSGFVMLDEYFSEDAQ